MKPDGTLKLVADVLDLPLMDSDGLFCGVVDDIEFSGRVGGTTSLKALLVGPGAYDGRLWPWASWIIRKVAGNAIVRVPMDRVKSITSMVHLNCPAAVLGLEKSEAKAARWVPHWGAL